MAPGALFPVVLNDDTYTQTDVNGRYVVARNGVFLERKTELFSAGVAVHAVEGLHPYDTWLELRVPPIPTALVERAVGFFRNVYRRWQGEAILFIYYAPGLSGPDRFVLKPPPQLIRGSMDRGHFRADLHLDYGTCDKPGPEYVKLGTIHSHGHAGPRHSTIDEHDELYEAGLHLVAGYVNTYRPAFAAAFVVGRTRFALEPRDVLQPFRTARRAPANWIDQVIVTCERSSLTAEHRQDIETQGYRNGYSQY